MLRDTILEHSFFPPQRKEMVLRSFMLSCRTCSFFFISSFPSFFLFYPTISLCAQTKPERDLTPITLLVSKADSLLIPFQVGFFPPISHFLPSHFGCWLHHSTWIKALTGCLSVLSWDCDKISCYK